VNILIFASVFVSSLLLDLLVGEYPSPIHPVVWMGNFIKRRQSAADRISGNLHRFIAGTVLVLSGIVVFAAVPLAFMFLLFAVDAPAAAVVIFAAVNVFIFKAAFSLSALWKAASSVDSALASSDITKARELTAYHLVSRNTAELDERELSAAVIESVAENFTDSVISPWFYFLIGGPAAAAVYRFVNTCDSMIGYHDERYEWFGKFAARLDDVLNFIPARLAGFLIVCAAALSRGVSGKRSLSVMLDERRVTASPNAGWTMSAAAGALGVKLVKKGCYSIDGGTELPVQGDIAVALVKTASSLAAVFVAAVIILCSGMFI